MRTTTHAMLLLYQEYSIIHLLSRTSKCYPSIQVKVNATLILVSQARN